MMRWESKQVVALRSRGRTHALPRKTGRAPFIADSSPKVRTIKWDGFAGARDIPFVRNNTKQRRTP